LAILWSGGLLRWRDRRGAALAAGVVVLAIVGQGALLALARTATFSDAFRMQMYRTTLQAARSFMPVGSGFGTFDPVYRMFEDPATLLRPYVNHAHNDWLELLLEGGLPAAGLALAGLIWFALSTARVWRSTHNGERSHPLLARAGWVVIALFLFHSLLDYPLRTTANAAVLALAGALLLPPLVSSRGGSGGRDAEERRVVRADAGGEHGGSRSEA
jgi:O-antigen ligase